MAKLKLKVVTSIQYSRAILRFLNNLCCGFYFFCFWWSLHLINLIKIGQVASFNFFTSDEYFLLKIDGLIHKKKSPMVTTYKWALLGFLKIRFLF
ncbi:hypothetical protein QTP88_019612 [Uroleucon formosanum]